MRVSFFILLFIGGLTALVQSAELESSDTISPSESTSTTTITTSTVVPTTTPYKPDDKEPVLFNVTDSKGKICILFKGLLKFNFSYRTVDNENATGSFFLPSESKGTKVSGSCEELSAAQTMNLTFFHDWTLSLSFAKNASTKNYQLEQFQLHYKLQNGVLPFPDAMTMDSKVATMKTTDYAVPELSSFLCLSHRTLEPETREEFGLESLVTANEQYEAFVSIDDVFFSTNRVRCKEDKMSNLVPIVVGIALAILIVIVLVAYLIGRHKSRKGYESV